MTRLLFQRLHPQDTVQHRPGRLQVLRKMEQRAVIRIKLLLPGSEVLVVR